jgi:hypothetical protein
MLSYHGTHGSLPPWAVVDKHGKPLLSWRVLVLPFIEQDDLYKQFKLDEPWDSPHNRRLLPKMPLVFKPFDGRAVEPDKTFFQVFIGRGAAFEGARGMKLPDDFPDGSSNTILIAQAEKAVLWTKPEDLEFAPDRRLPKLGGIFPETFQVALVDMSSRSISVTLSEQTLRAAITRNGGEILGSDWNR